MKLHFSQEKDGSTVLEQVPGLKPHKRWNNEGVASTVGTIMALMVFLAFLSMFTNQYIPVWMEENEAAHMSEAYGQFCNLKQAIDMQILAGTMGSGTQIGIYSPIKMGSSGIPMFATPTPGYLGVYRKASYDNVSFSFNATGTIMNPSSNVGGTIRLEVPNRYYVQQTLAYENDAIILQQPDGEYMRSTPQLFIQRVGSRFDLAYAQVDLRGDDTQYVGFGTRGIQTIMKAVTATTFTNLTVGAYPFIFINHTTEYESAWNDTFNQTLSTNGLTYGPGPLDDYFIVSTEMPTGDPLVRMWQVSLRINPASISRFTLTTAIVEVVTSEVGIAT